MSFNSRAWANGIKLNVEEAVELGLLRSGNEVQRLARGAAPVRKHRPFQQLNLKPGTPGPGRRNITPLTVLGKGHTAEVFAGLALTSPRSHQYHAAYPELQARFMKPKVIRSGKGQAPITRMVGQMGQPLGEARRTPGQAGPMQTSGQRDRAMNRLGRAPGRSPTAGWGSKAARLQDYRTAPRLRHMAKRVGVRLKPVSGQGEVARVALSEIRRARGVFFNIATGRFQYGGFLKASILRDEEVTRSGTKLSIRVVAHARYASYVEYGTYKMKGRPFLLPALMQTWARVPQYIGLSTRG